MRLTLTDLVDIVSASGTPKVTKVKQVKHRGAYSPATDFYRPFREQVAEVHAAGGKPGDLDRVLRDLQDAKKVSAYPALVDGYKKWWGKKPLKFSKPTARDYSAIGVDVGVNPELLFDINGALFLVKLYMKADPLAKNRVEVITHLMHVVHAPHVPVGTTMAVLDVRRAKLITPSVPIPTVGAMLDAELSYIASLWPNV